MKKRKKSLFRIIAVILILVLIPVDALLISEYFKKAKEPVSEVQNTEVRISSGFENLKVTDKKSAIDAIGNFSEELGIKNAEKELTSSNEYSTGNVTYYRMQQLYNGIPVYGKTAVLETDSDGNVLYLTANTSEVKVSGKAEANADSVYYEKDNRFYLCDVSFENDENGDTYEVFTDLASGDEIDRLCRTYTSDYAERENGHFVVKDTKRNLMIIDSQKKHFKNYSSNENDDYALFELYTKGSKKNSVIFDKIISNDNLANIHLKIYNDIVFPTANTEAELPADAVSVMKTVENIYDYYKKVHQLNGYDNYNGLLTININDGANSGNYPFFNQVFINLGYKSRITYDLVGHEYTHGVESVISNMTYEGESGALMEAYSDVFGELIEDYYSDEKTKADWIHGDRNLKDPNSVKLPSIYNGKNWKSTTETKDHGHVHDNSTVFSHAAYLMWKGINGDRNKKIDSINLGKLWLRALYLNHSNTSFDECAGNISITAHQMVEEGLLTSKQAECVDEAFSKVGIELKFRLSQESELKVYSVNGELYDSYHLAVTEEKDKNTVISSYITNTSGYKLSLNPGDYEIKITDTAADGSETVYTKRVNIPEKNDNCAKELIVNTDYGIKKIIPALSPEEAVNVYLNNKSSWMVYPDYMPMRGYAYYFFDFDMDGVLELMSNIDDGSGCYSYNTYYRINLNDNTVLEIPFSNYESVDGGGYDVFSDYPKLLKSKSDGSYLYFCKDGLNGGGYGQDNYYGTLYLKNRMMQSQIMFKDGWSNYDSETDTYTDNKKYYYSVVDNDNYQTVSKEVYDKKFESFLSGYEDMHLNQPCIVGSEIDTAPVSKQKELLLDAYLDFSYDGFSFNDISFG